MPKKGTKTQRRAAPARKKGAPLLDDTKDDGSRWMVVDVDGRQIYPGPGVPLGEAERLRDGLAMTCELARVGSRAS